MSKDKIADYDGATAGNNTDIGGISIAEGMLPSAVNNSMRELTRQLGAFADGTEGIDVLNLHDDDASASIKIQAPATVTTTTTFTLPDGDGTSGYALVTNGSGQLSWASVGGIANVADDTTPALGGDLDLNSNDITGTGNVDITGTLAAEGLTVDGATSGLLADFQNPAGNHGLRVRSGNNEFNDGSELVLDVRSGTSNNALLNVHAGGNVGIGEISPDTPVHINKTIDVAYTPTATTANANNLLKLENPSSTAGVFAGVMFRTGSGADGGINWVQGSGNDGSFTFTNQNTTDVEMMRIQSDGSVGIGVSSPSGKLHLSESGATNQAATIFSLDGYHSTFGANLAKSSGTYTTPAVSLSGGGWEYQPVNSLNNHGVMIYLSAPDTNTSASTPLERLRIDGSGNFLLGKSTASGANTEGVELRPTLSTFTSDGGTAVYVSRLTNNGDLIGFEKDSATIGSIGTAADRMYIGSNDTGLQFEGFQNDTIIPFNPSTGAMRSGAIDLGYSSSRFKNGYFSGTVYADQFLGQNDTNTGIAVGGNDVIQLSTGGSEKARVTATGQLLVGKTAEGDLTTDGIEIRGSDNSLYITRSSICAYLNRTTSDGSIMHFRRNNSTVGSISVTTSGTTYNTTSDLRLKENIEPLVATDKLMAMNPVSYNWKAEPDGPRSMGFIAQEMQDVMPEAVSVGDDEDAMMSMDYGRITPILVSALQDAHRKIEQLEQRLADMEAK